MAITPYLRPHPYAIALCVAGALLSACGGNPSVRKQKFLESGDQYIAQNKLPEAIIEYRNAIQIDAAFGEARKKLAQAYVKSGNVQHAYEEFVRAADLLPKDLEVQLTAGAYQLAARKSEEALGRADAALALDRTNVQAHLLRGNALAGLSAFDDALKAIEEAIRLEPGRGPTFTQLGLVEFLRGRRTEAEAAFKRAVELAPKSVESRLALGNFYWSTGRAKDTEDAFRGALSIQPDNGPANRAMAALSVATGKYRDAEQYLVRIADASKDVGSVFALAEYYIASGRARDAVARLEGLPENQRDGPGVGQRLARAYAAAGDTTKARTLIEQVLANNPTAVSAQLLKGQLLLMEGRGEEAFTAVRAAATADASSAEAQFALGRMYAARGDVTAAEAAYRDVLRINPRAAAAQTELAKLQLARGNAAESVRSAEEAAKSLPQSMAARLTLVGTLLAAKDFARAERELATLRKAAPNAAEIRVLEGTLALAKNDRLTARARFDQALAMNARSVEALAGLIALDFQANDRAAAIARVESRLQQEKTSDLLLLAARTYWTAQDVSSAEKMFRAAIDMNPSLLTSYELLGRLYISQKKLDQARAEFEALATKQVKPVGALTMTAIILQAQGQNALARQRYEQVLAIDSRAAIAANNLAWMHAESGEDLNVALQLAQTAIAVAPDAPEMMDTLGWVYYKRQLPSQAIPLFERSVEKAPTNPLFLYHLGLAYLQSGDDMRGRSTLQRALAAKPNAATETDIRRILAQPPNPSGKE